MIASFLIGLREGLEAALIVGLTLGVLRKMGREKYRFAVWTGVVVAIVVSLIAAVILQLLGAGFEGTQEKIFEGTMMFLAAGVLTWMIFWMQRQSQRIQLGIQSDVRQAAQRGRLWGLFSISFFAVLREGIEVALFLTAAAITASTRQTLIGGLLGITSAAVLGWMLFATTIRLDVGRFFQVTSVLLIMFAAGLFAHGVHEFNEVGWIPSIMDPVWDINHILSEDSFVGQILKALFGYNGNPSLTEVLAYISYYAMIIFGVRRLIKQRPEMVATTN